MQLGMIKLLLRRIFRRRVKLVDLTPYQRLLVLTVKK